MDRTFVAGLNRVTSQWLHVVLLRVRLPRAHPLFRQISGLERQLLQSSSLSCVCSKHAKYTFRHEKRRSLLIRVPHTTPSRYVGCGLGLFPAYRRRPCGKLKHRGCLSFAKHITCSLARATYSEFGPSTKISKRVMQPLWPSWKVPGHAPSRALSRASFRLCPPAKTTPRRHPSQWPLPS